MVCRPPPPALAHQGNPPPPPPLLSPGPTPPASPAHSFVIIRDALGSNVNATAAAKRLFTIRFKNVTLWSQLLQHLRLHCDDLTRCMGEDAVAQCNGTASHPSSAARRNMQSSLLPNHPVIQTCLCLRNVCHRARSLDPPPLPPPPPLLQVDVMPSAPIHDSHPARLQA
jgi:hypothetical protein